MRVRSILVVLVLLASASLLATADAPLAVHRAYHDVEVEPGVTLRVVEAWTDASLARAEPLAALFVSPTLVTHEVWDAQVPDDPTYSGLYQAAQRGYFAYAFDHWGYGDSSMPADGMEVTFERMLPQSAAVLEFARARSGAERIDIVSGSLGNSIAFALGGVVSCEGEESSRQVERANSTCLGAFDGGESPVADHVGAIVTTANVYANASLVLRSTILSPLACDVQPPPPEGYTDTAPPLYAIILWNAEPPAQLWGYQAFPGRYAQGPTQEGCDLPVYHASHGRAPVLVAYGDHDLLTDAADVEQFASEYGGPVELLFLPGGGHAPPFESVRHDFWDATFAWFDAHRD